MPANTVKVDRSTRWLGNPFNVTEDRTQAEAVMAFRTWLTVEGCHADMQDRKEKVLSAIRDYLPGKNLACWCPLDQPCHADVLLELANPGSKQ